MPNPTQSETLSHLPAEFAVNTKPLPTLADLHPEGFRPQGIIEMGYLVAIAKDAARLVALLADLRSPMRRQKIVANDFQRTLDSLAPQLASLGYLEPYNQDGILGVFYGG
jgi:hypothetical protein